MMATALFGGVQLAAPAAAASLQQVSNFGNNPSGLKMFVYVPNRVQPKPPILVAVHYCGGNASAFYGGGAQEWVRAADTYGYVVVFPEVTRSTQCFDVYSAQGLRRGGGSDADGIVSMVKYAEQHYNGDPDRVYTMGASSGAMMTNVLAGVYPDIFKAGVAFSGVPYTCFATTGGSTWNGQCSGGQVIKTAQQWGDAVRNANPNYHGPWPRMQLWHGATDTTLSYPNFGEEIKQWTNVHGLSQTPSFTDHPSSTWTRTRYGSTGTQPAVEGISISNTGHTLPQNGMAAYGIKFLGLDGTTTPSPTPTTPTPTTPTPTTPTPTTPSPTTSSPTVQPGACTAAVKVDAWNTGFVANVTLTAGQPISHWRATIALPNGTLTGGWSATFTGTGGTITATGMDYNSTLGTGQTATFGFQGSGTPTGLTVTCNPI